MVKSLDPNTPSIREAVQESVAINIGELVARFASVSFNSSSQKLAVGTGEGLIYVYDLSTSCQSQKPEGLTVIMFFLVR